MENISEEKHRELVKQEECLNCYFEDPNGNTRFKTKKGLNNIITSCIETTNSNAISANKCSSVLLTWSSMTK